MFKSENKSRIFNFGKINNISDKPCHHRLLQWIRDSLVSGQEDYDIGGVQFQNHVVVFCHAWSRATFLATAPEDGSRFVGRVVDSDWVDLDLLRDWKTMCITEHGERCCNPLQLSRAYPAWLVDTYNNCVVPGDGISEYVALSYVWGTKAYLRCESANLDALQHQGALSEGPLSTDLPPTISDAMGLVRSLQERYLWVDALCIVQDAPDQTREQLLIMAKIYAFAVFTIVAADGDASEGLPGIPGISAPRNFNQLVVPFAANETLIVRENMDFDSRYFHRAWTFQEYAMSQRLLIIRKKQFNWVCSSIGNYEDSVYDDLYRGPSLNIPQIQSGNPCLEELQQVFEIYNDRELSFPEDALAGVTGILDILGRTFEGGFLYGLPVMYFEATLMWKTSGQRIRRRLHSGKQHSILEGSCLPSWSWLGWKTSHIYFNESDGDLERFGTASFSITQWYSHQAPMSSDRRAIGPCFPGRMLNPDDDCLDDPLAQGWAVNTYNPDVHGSSGPLVGNRVYRHSLMPGQTFWRWVPFKDPRDKPCPTTHPQHPFVSCRTRRGWFLAKRWNFRFRDNAKVFDMNRSPCGRLQVTSEETLTELPAPESSQYEPIELSAICLRKVHPEERKHYVDYLEMSESDETYGVLWVEWEDGVAYRKAVGEIDKEAWEAHDLEDVDLVLG
ncbi:hypothetical protein PG991_006298 [Apiospora marii]|uniref:Heterokaryon incompatibility domain-containing protein n=1 Tax=Apiospora marii TaxID=335849 RepID=A0ABR1SBM0_9PEZI